MKIGYIMVEIVGSNPAGQVKIKPLCSNCDGKEAWVKPEDILTHMNYIAEEYLKNMPAEELRRALGIKETERITIKAAPMFGVNSPVFEARARIVKSDNEERSNESST